MGDMAIDKESQRDVLCIAGGTGLAPIKAMVDEMTRWNTARRVTVFFGVRQADDLYDMGALHRLAALNRWLTVVPCVSDDLEFIGEHGTLADVVSRHGSVEGPRRLLVWLARHAARDPYAVAGHRCT